MTGSADEDRIYCGVDLGGEPVKGTIVWYDEWGRMNEAQVLSLQLSFQSVGEALAKAGAELIRGVREITGKLTAHVDAEDSASFFARLARELEAEPPAPYDYQQHNRTRRSRNDPYGRRERSRQAQYQSRTRR